MNSTKKANWGCTQNSSGSPAPPRGIRKRDVRRKSRCSNSGIERKWIAAIHTDATLVRSQEVATHMTDSHDRADGFEALLKPHLDRMYRLAYRLTGRRHDAEDLVQDTLVKLYRRRDELSSIRELKPWLGRVLFNQFVDDKRRYGRQALHLVDSNIEPDECAAPASARLEPDAVSARDEAAATLTRALSQLSEEHRLVLMLHDVEGYKLTEIQELTGIPVGTVKSRLHRARGRLREILSSQGTFSDASSCNSMDGVKTDAV